MLVLLNLEWSHGTCINLINVVAQYASFSSMTILDKLLDFFQLGNYQFTIDEDEYFHVCTR